MRHNVTYTFGKKEKGDDDVDTGTAMIMTQTFFDSQSSMAYDGKSFTRHGPYISFGDSETGTAALQMQNAEGGSNEGGWRISRPVSRDERVIVDFFPLGTCGDGHGFNEQDSMRVPGQLSARGLSHDVWLEWVRKLQTDVLPHGPTCGQCGGFWCCLTVFGLPFWCSQWGTFQSRVRQWTDDLNQQVLSPLGMFAATQTAMYDEQHGNTHYHEELSWLAVATTADEIAALKEEVHIWRYQPGCPCCLCCGCPEQSQVVPSGDCGQNTYCCCGSPRVV